MLGEWTQANNVRVLLSSSITNVATSITVTAASAPYNNPANPASDTASNGLGIATLIDVYANPTKTEIVTYTTLTNNGNGTYTLSGVTRAREGTTAQAFSAGATLVQTITAAQLKHSKVTYDKTTDTLRAGGNLLVVGQTNTTGGIVVGGGGSVTCDAGFYTAASSYFGAVNGSAGNFTGLITGSAGADITGSATFHSATTFSVQIQFTPMTAPGSPANGWVYYDSGTKRLQSFDGGVWLRYVTLTDVTGGTLALAGSNLSGTNTGDITIATFGSAPAANGATLSGQALTLQPADATRPGAVSIAAQTFGGDKTFDNVVGKSLASKTSALGTVAGTATANFSTAATVTATLTTATACTFSFTAPANANTIVVLKVTQPGSGTATTITLPGTVKAGSFGTVPAIDQTLGASTTFVMWYDGTNYILIDCSTGFPAVGTFGSTPNANGASVSGTTFTLQPADATRPGSVSIAAQTFGGDKTFDNVTGKNLAYKTNANGTVGGTATINFSTGAVQTLTLTASTPCKLADGGHAPTNSIVQLVVTQPVSNPTTIDWTGTLGLLVLNGTYGGTLPPQPDPNVGIKTTYTFFWNGTNYLLLNCTSAQLAPTLVDKSTVGSTTTLDFRTGSLQKFQTISATACTISFTAPTNPSELWIEIVAPASGTTPTMTWPTVKGGTMPATVTLAKKRMVNLFYDGTDYVLMAQSAEY
jgi:hypothetical protein